MEKISNSLAEKGYTVHILSRNRNNSTTLEKIGQNIFVHRLPAGIGKISNLLINFPAFFSPTWLIKLFHIVKTYNIKLIIVRDLPLGPLAYIIGKIKNIPTILDMAENYPELIKSTWVYKGPKVQDYIIRNPFLLKIMEKWLLLRVNGILVVSNNSLERVKLLIRGKKTPVWIVGNTPRLNKSTEMNYHPIIEKIKAYDGLKLIYTGMIESHRGLDTVLKSIPYIIKKGIDIMFIIVGKGTYENNLKDIAKNYNIQDHVLFVGWIDSSIIPLFISESDICIVPHYVTEHTNTTIPNKIFDYMLQKKPVVATNSVTLMHIINSTKCGFIYKDNSPEELSEIIEHMNNKELRDQVGLFGYNAIHSFYNWDKDKEILFKSIEATILK